MVFASAADPNGPTLQVRQLVAWQAIVHSLNIAGCARDPGSDGSVC